MFLNHLLYPSSYKCLYCLTSEIYSQTSLKKLILKTYFRKDRVMILNQQWKNQNPGLVVKYSIFIIQLTNIPIQELFISFQLVNWNLNKFRESQNYSKQNILKIIKIKHMASWHWCLGNSYLLTKTLCFPHYITQHLWTRWFINCLKSKMGSDAISKLNPHCI